MKLKEKQKGFLLNPYRFGSGAPFVLGTTNVLSGFSTSNMTIISPFREYSAGSLARINDGNLLSASSDTIAIHGGTDTPGEDQGWPPYNNGGGIQFTFPTPIRIGQVKVSMSPLNTIFNDFYSFIPEYYDFGLNAWVSLGIESNSTNSNYQFMVEDISYEDWPDAISTEWRVIANVGLTTLSHEVRFGEIEMYEWIAT